MKTTNSIKFIMLMLLSLACTSVLADDNSMSTTTTSTPTTNGNSSMTSSSMSSMSTDDASITTKVKSLVSHQFKKANITINTQDGVVTLTGNLNSERMAQILILAAASIKGVKDVDTTNLTVNNNPLSKDLAITAKVKGTLARERNGLAKNITVQTNNGTVILTGKVSTQDQADQATQLAKSINGVDNVQSKITVQSKSKSGY